MAALRAQMAYFAILCIMVLAIPLVLPVAKAHAFLSGLIICTQTGAGPQPLSAHADCPCALTCNSCAGGAFLKALHDRTALATTPHEPRETWWSGGSSRSAEDAHESGANSIRGPPSLV
jgi:hypothetical protein